MQSHARRAAVVGMFRDLAPDALDAIDARLSPQFVGRGTTLVSVDDATVDALYIVVSGRFAVLHGDGMSAHAEIGPGSPIGEIAFFAGGRRTATVKALRDSVVLRLSRSDFDDVAARNPALWKSVGAALARRLTETALPKARAPAARARTIAIIPAGAAALPREEIAALCAQLQAMMPTAVVGAGEARALAGGSASYEPLTHGLNALESRHELVVYVADDSMTPWSEKAIRQADLVLAVAQRQAGDDSAGNALNALEQQAATISANAKFHLALVRAPDQAICGTRAYLDKRPHVHLHHHIAAGDSGDIARLARFLTGRALGLVACGGGALCAMHIGIYEALREAGIPIDAAGGTSGGAAMTAAFARGVAPWEIAAAFDDIFVKRRAMRRWTWPRYSLIDHGALEEAFAAHFSDADIADLPIPYFALSTNLTRGVAHCHTRGPVWEAVRASCAIPALLPPWFTPAGDMLVDGCLVDNVPIAPMHAMKLGPNIVVDFEVPDAAPAASGNGLPSRWQIAAASLSRRGRARLPRLPGPHSVLLKSLLLHGRCDTSRLGRDDLLLAPAIPAGIQHLDWHRHKALRDAGLTFARAALEAHRAAGHAVAAEAVHEPA